MSRLFDWIKKKPFLSTALGVFKDDQLLKIALVTKDRGKIEVSSCLSFSNEPPALPVVQRVASGLQAHEIVFRSLFLPLKNKRKVIDALPFQLETVLPFPVEQSIVCPYLHSAGRHSTFVSLIATSKELLKKHLCDCSAVDIHPDVVSCVPLALFRLTRWQYPEQKDLLVFHFGIHKTSCIAIQDGLLTLSQSIRVGKADLDAVLQSIYSAGESNASSDVSMAAFQEKLSNELERLSIFLKEKIKIPETVPWLLLGELTTSAALNQIWKKIFSGPELVVGSESLHSHGVCIGLALDAMATDDSRIQFLQEEFIPQHHLQKRKKRGLLFALGCVLLTVMVGLTSSVLLKKRTRMLSDKFHSYFSSSQKTETLSLAVIEQELLKSESALLKQKSGFPFFLATPKVSEVLAWLCTHPSFATSDGLAKEGIDIKSFRYQLIKFPHLEDASAAYQAVVDIEFTAATPRSAREFHDALMKGDRIVNAKKELKWNTQGSHYSVQFELNKSAAS